MRFDHIRGANPDNKILIMRVERTLIMRIIGYLFILGGIVRLFADETIFELLSIQGAWTDHPYFIYIYRVLGAFVIMVGLVVIQVSGNPGKYGEIMRMLMWGFLVTGAVMLVTGILTGLPNYLFVLDALFVFVLAILFDGWRKRTK